MTSIAFELEEAMKAAGVASIGAVIGRMDDKSTWSVGFATEPSADQKDAAAKVIDDFDLEVAQARVNARIQLAMSDQKMARVVEDLIDLLIVKGVFDPKEFSRPVKDLLASRKSARAVLNGAG
jgi:hypothetical protein